MTNINCSSNCIYQKNGNCSLDSVKSCVLCSDGNCIYYTQKEEDSKATKPRQ
ncbi:MAG: hydroxymyristoyl-ACP dehydratase [Clostridia bacterium]|nr:hydroxymyristoyl-ACP dehydratase [Clostridia bacterium]